VSVYDRLVTEFSLLITQISIQLPEYNAFSLSRLSIGSLHTRGIDEIAKRISEVSKSIGSANSDMPITSCRIDLPSQQHWIPQN